MNNIIILGIAILILLIVFIVIVLIMGKNKIRSILIPLDISKQDINEYLKLDAKECMQSNLIDILDKTTVEINEYVDNYEELLKNTDFMDLKRKLYNIQVNLEATIDYYNNKLITYNTLKDNGPTNFATKFFTFDDYSKIKNEKEEISRLINLN